MGKLKIAGVSIALGWFGVIVLSIFIKSIDYLSGDFIQTNAKLLAIISGAILLILVITGVISLGIISKKGKSLISE